MHMPNSDRRSLEKILRAVQAWETHRPKKSFAGMTLAEFKDKVQPSAEIRTELDTLRSQVEEAVRRRREADLTSTDACSKLVNAVRGDFNEGDDSPFYKALGYTPRSERKSGLHRSSQPTILKKAA